MSPFNPGDHVFFDFEDKHYEAVVAFDDGNNPNDGRERTPVRYLTGIHAGTRTYWAATERLSLASEPEDPTAAFFT